MLGPTNPKAYEFVKPEIAKQMPTYPQNAKQTITANAEWEAANSAILQERFTQWLAELTVTLSAAAGRRE